MNDNRQVTYNTIMINFIDQILQANPAPKAKVSYHKAENITKHDVEAFNRYLASPSKQHKMLKGVFYTSYNIETQLISQLVIVRN